jgi:hypothetical protein
VAEVHFADLALAGLHEDRQQTVALVDQSVHGFGRFDHGGEEIFLVPAKRSFRYWRLRAMRAFMVDSKRSTRRRSSQGAPTNFVTSPRFHHTAQDPQSFRFGSQDRKGRIAGRVHPATRA